MRADIIEQGKAAYASQIEAGAVEADALTAAMEAVGSACVAIAESWAAIADRHEVTGGWAARKIASDLMGRE